MIVMTMMVQIKATDALVWPFGCIIMSFEAAIFCESKFRNTCYGTI